MNNILYFEGAGMDYVNENSNVGNHRIRTAFLNNEGKAIYLELSGHEFNEKKKERVWKSHVNYVFFITEDEKERQYLQLPYTREGYTKEKITEWINSNLNCSFDNIEVLPWLEGYRVHGDHNCFNLINNHSVNKERAAAREKEYNKIDMYFRNKLNEKYSVISLLKMDNESITIRCHVSKQSLEKAGLTDNDREHNIPVNY